MYKSIHRIFVLIFIFALCAAMVPLQVFATPQTHPNTHKNTGDQRADVIAVALTQVGYMEGPNNDTKYGVWYGYNNIAWCGTFVAWCANQAGVPTSVLARTGVANPSAYGLVAEPEGYVPKPGDLFFAKDHTHVGFVYYVEGSHFYTLEGNTWENGPEGVYIRKRALSGVEFASPKYQGGSGHSYVLTSETQHPHKEKYQCSDCGDHYYTGKNIVRSDCQTCIQISCNHKFSGFTQVSDSQHRRACTLCGKVETVNHVWNAGTTQKTATCGSAGSKLQKCLECGLEAVRPVAATGRHDYSEWEFVDQGTHSRQCSDCGRVETAAHDQTAQWQTDINQHWHACQTCSQQVGKEAHTFGPDCDSPCTVCQYERLDGHQFTEGWQTDEISHWQSCKVCLLVDKEENHIFTAECDDTCDTCGYTRQTQHSFATEYTTDGESHWYACSVCGKQDALQPHTPEELLREGAMQHCTVCQMPLTEESSHTHGYDTVHSDVEQHWGTCSCGLEMLPQSHQWSVRTQTCSVCAQPMPGQQADFSGLIPWIAAAVAILVVGTLLLILVLRKKK